MRPANTAPLLALLVLAVGINYIDRGSLAVVKTDVAKAFRLDDVQMGLLFSAFFWTYAVCQVFAGWLVDRFDVKRVYAVGFLVWSLAILATGAVQGFAAILVTRLLLGAGESVAYPATSRVIVENFAERRRGLANALVDAGSKVGTALSTLVGGFLAAWWGWRSLFVILGVASLTWIVPWLVIAPRGRREGVAADGEPAPAAAVGFGRLLGRVEVWGTSVGFFCLGYSWFFLVFWVPPFLEEQRGFSKEGMALAGSLPFWAMAVTSVASGWLSDAWIAGGASPTVVRKGFLITGFSLCAIFLTAVAFVPGDAATLARRPPDSAAASLSLGGIASGDVICVALLTAACASLGLYSSNAWAVTQTLAGPAAAGRWSGVKNAVGTLGGAASPVVTGWIVKETGSYAGAFGAAAGMLVVGVFAYVFLVGKIAPLDWDAGPAGRADA